MLPAKRNKVDLSKLSDEERKIFRLYGKLPTGKDVLSNKLKERKYFDSGDYALSKAGKTSGPVGVQHPSPETIPHANAIATITHNSSPVKESSLVHETEIDEKAGDSEIQATDAKAGNSEIQATDAKAGNSEIQATDAKAGNSEIQATDADTQATPSSTSSQTTTVSATPVQTPNTTIKPTNTSSLRYDYDGS